MGSVASAIAHGFEAAIIELTLTIVDVICFFLILVVLLVIGFCFARLIIVGCRCLCCKKRKNPSSEFLAKSL
nr:MAG: E protein [Jingmen shrew arterivirus 1]